MRALLLLLLLCAPLFAQDDFGPGGGAVSHAPTVAEYNVQDTLTNWTTCTLPNCNPGGTGTPTATSQTINNATPSVSGASMEFSQTTSSNYTNVLWPFKPTICDACTTINSDFWVYLTYFGNPAEMDSFNFDHTHNVMNMWGLQCNFSAGYWQIANDTSSWTNTSVACSLPSGWHHIQVHNHRVIGDTGCGGTGCNYYDYLIVDGVGHALNVTEPAEALPTGWTSAIGFQFQIDVGTVSSSTTTTMNLDNASFWAD
jgi:hypothetical protein